jgi:hypothetical protein
MNRLAFVFAVSLLVVAGVGAANAAMFEGSYLRGSANGGFQFFRVDVATGQVFVIPTGANAMTPVVDATALPSGDYHLYLASDQPTAQNVVPWGLMRMDSKSGRVWSLLGGGPTPFSWVEAAAPK